MKQISVLGLSFILCACGGQSKSGDAPLIVEGTVASSPSPAPTAPSAASATTAAPVGVSSATESVTSVTSVPVTSAPSMPPTSQPSTASASAGPTPPTPASSVSLADLHPLAAVPWLPTGALGEDADLLNASIGVFSEAFCRSGLGCLMQPTDDDRIRGCALLEFRVFAPSLEWLACAVTSDQHAYLQGVAAAFQRSAEQYTNAACEDVMDLDFPMHADLSQCPPWELSAYTCPDTGTEFKLCDGTNDCSNGFDELNCVSRAASYQCSTGPNVAWTAVCDGKPDCTDGNDEFACLPM